MSDTVYNPTVVYGTWAHPAYPPYFWHPPGYAASRLFWFGTGVIVGRALWGGVNWGRSTVNININRYNQFNRTNINNPRWRHNPSHRRAVPYRDRRVAERYGGPRTRDTRSREQFRGRAETARRDLQRPGAGQRPTDRQARQGTQNQRQKAGQRPADRQVQQPRRDRQAQQPRQTRQTQQRRSATSGAGNGRQVRQDSSRGRSSRSAQRPRPRQSSGGRRRR